MSKIKVCLSIDDDFGMTMKKKYPFVKSLSHAVNQLNLELKQQMGITNDKIFKLKKR